MILYLDTSAWVKQYVAERGSEVVHAAIATAQMVGVSLIGRVELEAALAKYVRMQKLSSEAGLKLRVEFLRDWPVVSKINLTEAVVETAGRLAWDYNLRGYDAVHLASAVIWQGALDETVTLATFDKHLWEAAASAGLTPYPTDLASYL